MLSKNGFQHHLNNIAHASVMARAYAKQVPELAKKYLESVETSKQILINHFEETERPGDEEE